MKTTGYNEFLEVFGGITLGATFKFILAVCFLAAFCTIVGRYLLHKYSAMKQKDEQLKAVFEMVNSYPQYREQSLQIQQELTSAISAITDRIDKMEENIKKRKVNELRMSLLQSYNYYTSDQHNPKKAITQLESDSFWASFGDYEELDGNGHMHTTVQPEMLMLKVIPMDNIEAIAELMSSRR